MAFTITYSTHWNRWSGFSDDELVVLRSALVHYPKFFKEISSVLRQRERYSQMDPWNEGEDPWMQKN